MSTNLSWRGPRMRQMQCGAQGLLTNDNFFFFLDLLQKTRRCLSNTVNFKTMVCCPASFSSFILTWLILQVCDLLDDNHGDISCDEVQEHFANWFGQHSAQSKAISIANRKLPLFSFQPQSLALRAASQLPQLDVGDDCLVTLATKYTIGMHRTYIFKKLRSIDISSAKYILRIDIQSLRSVLRLQKYISLLYVINVILNVLCCVVLC